MAILGHIWPYMAIGDPSCPKLVEHWLNLVEHCGPHQGDHLDPFAPTKSDTGGSQRAPKTAISSHIWPYLSKEGPSCPKLVEQLVHMGGPKTNHNLDQSFPTNLGQPEPHDQVFGDFR